MLGGRRSGEVGGRCGDVWGRCGDVWRGGFVGDMRFRLLRCTFKKSKLCLSTMNFTSSSNRIH